MASKDELILFVVRSASRRFGLITDEGTLILEGDTWRELKRDLAALLQRDASNQVKVSICVGQPRPVTCPPPSPSRPRLAPVMHPSL